MTVSVAQPAFRYLNRSIAVLIVALAVSLGLFRGLLSAKPSTGSRDLQ